MALVSFLPAQRVEIPHEPGNWIEFRKPSGAVVREARRVVESEGRKGVRDFGAEIVKDLDEATAQWAHEYVVGLLHQALSQQRDEDGERIAPPFLWLVSRLCEEFGGWPTRALWELEHDPDGMAVKIHVLRSYAAARREYQEASKKDAAAVKAAIERNPMGTQVIDIEHELVAEELERRKAAAIARAMAEEI